MNRAAVSRWLVVGLAGLLLSAIGLFVDPRQAYTSYLAAYATGLSLALGALALVMISYLTGARWFVPLRPLAEAITDTLPLLALLFLPLLPGLPELYPWVSPQRWLSPDLQEQIRLKQAYLNVPFFLARAAGYFAVWIALASLLRRVGERRALCAVGLPALGLTLTFAAFDWLMSLSPGWFSTIYGVYYFAGGFLGALALMAVLATGIPESRQSPAGITTQQYHSLGKLLLTFVLFWAYIGYSQLLIVWIGDIPAEVTWYAPRMRGSWAVLGIVLIAGQFGLPFLLLLFRAVTTRAGSLAALGGWLLLMHYLDIYWLVLPELHQDGVHPHWLDLSALMAVGGLMLAWGCRRLRHSTPTEYGAIGAVPEPLDAT